MQTAEGGLPAAQIVIVPTPASTNAQVLQQSAPSIPPRNITTLTRLAHNRALAQVLLSCWPPSYACHAQLATL
jgi:malate/lactate dehydrogenase